MRKNNDVEAALLEVRHLVEVLAVDLGAARRIVEAVGIRIVRRLVEVGPGNVLSGLVKRIDKGVKAIPVNSLAALERVEEALGAA